MLSGVAVTIS